MNSNKIPMLSKSRYLSGLQCHLRLWHSCFNRELASEVTPSQQALFDTGHSVGQLATRLFPEGILIREDHLHHQEAVQTTEHVLIDPNVSSIFEAAFLYHDVRIRVDILKRLDNVQWDMVEVKSSTSVKEIHLPDVAIQYYVLNGSGLKINRVFLLLINNRYVYDGKRLDLEDFFYFSDVTDQALSIQGEIPLRINEQKKMLDSSGAPVIQPSRHCTTPFTCEFWEYCTKDMPEHWIFNLYGISQKKFDELTGMSVKDIKNIPDAFNLTELQERMKKCVKKNDAYISNKLHAQLTNLEYPVHFLDFETVNPAIPLYSDTSPYEVIPFQWSDHILHKDGLLVHKEYLCEDHRDPREDFTRTLLEALDERGSIFIYTTYEKIIIKRLAEHLPQYRDDLLRIPNRFKDLCSIIRHYFYHPGFHGSFSLKSVLPVLVPEMSYNSLSIKDGSHASFEYLRLIHPDTPPGEKEKIKEDLLVYCSQDTLAMVRIRDQLMK
jgi:predicted RecB family nuclease